jgi:hypothetical protein
MTRNHVSGEHFAPEFSNFDQFPVQQLNYIFERFLVAVFLLLFFDINCCQVSTVACFNLFQHLDRVHFTFNC